jgi:hypothetical protein
METKCSRTLELKTADSGSNVAGQQRSHGDEVLKAWSGVRTS